MHLKTFFHQRIERNDNYRKVNDKITRHVETIVWLEVKERSLGHRIVFDRRWSRRGSGFALIIHLERDARD